MILVFSVLGTILLVSLTVSAANNLENLAYNLDKNHKNFL